MKNKKMTYLLGLAVVVIWGIIVYRVVIGLQADDDEFPTPTAITVKKQVYDDYSVKPDTTKLALNYRDPFGLEPVKETAVKAVRPIVTRQMLVKSNTPQINWGGIRYSGFIRNPETKRLVSIVSIQGKSTMLQDGETQDGLKLIKNLKDSIKVSYRGASRFIKLNNN